MYVIVRQVPEVYYFLTFAFLIFSFYLIFKNRLVKFGAISYLVAVSINFLWELSLMSLGLRHYTFPFQFLYQSLTEFGPPFLISLFVMDKLKLISLERFKDDYSN